MPQAQVLSPSQFRSVMAIADTTRHGLRNQLVLALSYYAALRVGEIAALDIGQVYDADLKPRDTIVLYGRQTKSGRHHTVYVHPKLSKIFVDYVVRLENKSTDAPLIQSQKNARRYNSNALCRLFGQLYRKANLYPHFTSHSGRRTFITNLANANVNPKAIMELVNHKHLTTTQRYIETTPAQLANAVGLIK